MLDSLASLPSLLLVLLCVFPLLSAFAMAALRRPLPAVATVVVAGSFGLSLMSFAASVAAPAAANELLRLDRLSAIMLVLVTGVSTIVHAFSIRYMDSDPQYARFFVWLSFVTGVVLIIAVANNLALLAIGWFGVSLGLYQLQTHYRKRSGAMAAARLMRASHVVGDVALVLGCVVLGVATSETRIDLALSKVHESPPAIASISVTFLAIAAFSKSSQIPFHRWLPDTMEAPTPVSAIMHAGIVNSGGFLLARFSPLLVHVPGIAFVIVLVGAATALWGACCMLVRSDVKRGLAFSTQSQMGYMIMQCGIGAFPAAIMHLFAHGIFKATLFLGSGYAINDHKRALRAPATFDAGSERRGTRIAASILVAPIGVLTALSDLGRALPPYGWILLAFATLTCMQLTFAIVRRGAAVEIGVAALIVIIALPLYALSVTSFDRFLAGDVHATTLLVAPHVATVVVGIFACGLVLGWGFIAVPRSLRDRAYVWLLTERVPSSIAR